MFHALLRHGRIFLWSLQKQKHPDIRCAADLFVHIPLVTTALWRYFYYVSCKPKFIAGPERGKYRVAKATRNFRSRREVYRNVVKQLAPTRSMASFVLLQPTVLENHVSVFCEMFRFERRSRSRSRYRRRRRTQYIHEPSFQQRINRSTNWPSKSDKRDRCAFRTSKIDFQILAC